MLEFVMTLVTITLHSSYRKSRIAVVDVLDIIKPEAKVRLFNFDSLNLLQFFFLHNKPKGICASQLYDKSTNL